MTYALAGQFGPEAIITLSGAPQPSVEVHVYQTDGVTHATLYTARTKTLTAGNPVVTDNAGNLLFYADPGRYVLAATVAGTTRTFNVTVSPDPADVEPLADLGATYVPFKNATSGLGPSNVVDLEYAGTGTSTNDRSVFFKLKVSNDNIVQTIATGGTKVDGLLVSHEVGGSAQGGRNAIEGQVYLNTTGTSPSNADRSYVGTTGLAAAYVGDNGTSAPSWQGAMFGLNGYARLLSEAYWYQELCGIEVNTLTDPSSTGSHPTWERAQNTIAVSIVSEHQRRAFNFDAAVGISGLSNLHLGYKDAILIGTMNGARALANDSTIMRTVGETTLAHGLNFNTTTFTADVLATANMNLSESTLLLKGSLQLSGGAADHEFQFGRIDGTASAPHINFHSGATATSYDAQITASGGDGTQGHGNLVLNAQQVKVQGQTNVTGFVVDVPTGQTADITQFKVNSATVLGVKASGQLLTVAANEATGAGSAALGSNSPAVTNTAPYKWLKFTTSDGSQVYVPAWK